MTVTDHPALTAARRRGELAERMVRVAIEFACLVRDHDREMIGEFLAPLTEEERAALLVVQAAMIPVDRPASELLSWVSWDETFRPVPAGAVYEDPAPPVAVKPKRRSPGTAMKPCGSYAAYRRHKDRGEVVDEACGEAAREYWAAHKRNRRRGRVAAAEAGTERAA